MKYRPSTEGEEIVKKDYRKKIIFSLEDFDEKGHLLQVVTIPPQTRQRMHFHEEQTEVFYILEGEAAITINGVDYIARSGDAFICSPGDVHNLYTDNKTRTITQKVIVSSTGCVSNWPPSRCSCHRSATSSGITSAGLVRICS